MEARDHYRVIDELETEILDLSRQMDTTMYRYLVRVREFDERRGWLAYGFTDCSHWLSFRCGVTLQTGADHVRVARALKELKCVSEALADGTLSYSKVRALVRLATPETEAELVAFATDVSTSAVEARLRELRNGTAGSLADARRVQEARSLKRSVNEATGLMTLEVVLPLEAGELVMRAIDQATADEDPLCLSDYFARQADAWLQWRGAR